jgi:hypothetical protein
MTWSKIVAAMLFLMALSGPAPAHEFPIFDDGVRDCYGRAMIGFDSVINARLGIPPEHALALAQITDISPIAETMYRDDILIVMWGAYLWTGSPHNYAINVFYRCAREQDRTTKAEFGG